MKTLTLLVVSAAILFDALDLSITQVALPSIQGDLHVSAAALQWVPNAYVLTYGGLLLLGGRAADLLGRRRTFVAGLLVFAAMSLACGLAPSMGVLVVARGLQGIGAAMTVPAAVSIIAISFAEGPERNRALGVFGACASAGFSVGLVAGGVLTDALDWRWIFLAKVPFVLAVAVLAWRAVDPATDTIDQVEGYDARGALLAASGALLAVLVITQLADPTLDAVVLVAVAVLAIACVVAFVVNERRVRDPLLPLDIFRLRTLRYADLASLTVLNARRWRNSGIRHHATGYMRGDLVPEGGHSVETLWRRSSASPTASTRGSMPRSPASGANSSAAFSSAGSGGRSARRRSASVRRPWPGGARRGVRTLRP
jgi:MFS family permease